MKKLTSGIQPFLILPGRNLNYKENWIVCPYPPPLHLYHQTKLVNEPAGKKEKADLNSLSRLNKHIMGLHSGGLRCPPQTAIESKKRILHQQFQFSGYLYRWSQVPFKTRTCSPVSTLNKPSRVQGIGAVISSYFL